MVESVISSGVLFQVAPLAKLMGCLVKVIASILFVVPEWCLTRGKPSQIWSSEWQLMMINGQFGWLNHVQPPSLLRFFSSGFYGLVQDLAGSFWFNGRCWQHLTEPGSKVIPLLGSCTKFAAIQQQNRTIDIHKWWKVHPCSMEMALFVSFRQLFGGWMVEKSTNQLCFQLQCFWQLIFDPVKRKQRLSLWLFWIYIINTYGNCHDTSMFPSITEVRDRNGTRFPGGGIAAEKSQLVHSVHCRDDGGRGARVTSWFSPTIIY